MAGSRSYAVETISSLPFGTIIGSPMTAAIQAQAQAARSTMDFILDVGFYPTNSSGNPIASSNGQPVTSASQDSLSPQNPGTNNNNNVRMVTFTYTKSVPPASASAGTTGSGSTPTNPNSTFTITVPLLSVVPIPFIEIDEMTIDFVANITESISSSINQAASETESASTSITAGGCFGPIAAVGEFKGSVSSTHSSNSQKNSKYQTELTMSIHVRASSSSMPKGMAKILDILAGLIQQQAPATTTPGTTSASGTGG